MAKASGEKHLPTQAVAGDLKSNVIRWALGQEANTLLLFAIVAGIGWLAWFAVTQAIPKHIEAINSGYKAVADEHGKVVNEIETRHSANLKSQQSTFEKTIEKHDELLKEVFQRPKNAAAKSTPATEGDNERPGPIPLPNSGG